MLAILEFIFRSGWHFLGCVVLLIVVCEGISDIVQALRRGE